MQPKDPSASQNLSWWSDVSPSLMTNKTIRNFLTHYSQSQHPEVVKLVLLYGVLSLQSRVGLQPVSLDDIRQLLKKGFFSQTLGSKIQGVKSSVSDIQHMIEEFARGVDDQEQRAQISKARGINIQQVDVPPVLIERAVIEPSAQAEDTCENEAAGNAKSVCETQLINWVDGPL